MEVFDGRGAHKKRDAAKNKERVRKWFVDNPGTTITECCNGLHLSYVPVRKHINALMEEHEVINGK